MIFGQQVFDYIKLNDIGQVGLNPDTGFLFVDFSADEIIDLTQKGLVYDARKGGLVLGKLHSEGGVHILQPISGSRYRYVGEMECWEYISSPLNDQDIQNKLNQIRTSNPNPNGYKLEPFDIPDNCNVIDTSKSDISFIVISAGTHFILNRYATKNFISEILELDI